MDLLSSILPPRLLVLPGTVVTVDSASRNLFKLSMPNGFERLQRAVTGMLAKVGKPRNGGLRLKPPRTPFGSRNLAAQSAIAAKHEQGRKPLDNKRQESPESRS